MLSDPPILLLDEPFSAMDDGMEARIKRNILNAAEGKTMIVVTHHASMLTIVDRLLLLDDGRLVADGPKDVVLKALKAGQVKVKK